MSKAKRTNTPPPEPQAAARHNLIRVRGARFGWKMMGNKLVELLDGRSA